MKRTIAALMILSALCAFATLAEDESPAPAKPAINVARVETAPDLDADHAAWDAATEGRVLARAGHIGDTWVHLKAVHDGEYLYLRAHWADTTESLNRNWEWTEAGWTKTQGNEDRLSIVFNISTPEFDREGCDAMCHVDMLYTPAAGQKLDMWHWKAQRGGKFGFTDDQALISLEDGGNPNGQKGRKSGRINDAGRSGYSSNATEDGKAPARVWLEDADQAGPFNAETSRATPDNFAPKAGYVVPREALRDSAGSRGDVSSSAAWVDGKWTVVFKRKLATGHDDDAQFKAGGSVSFALAVFDNTDANVGNEHAKSGVAILKFAE